MESLLVTLKSNECILTIVNLYQYGEEYCLVIKNSNGTQSICNSNICEDNEYIFYKDYARGKKEKIVLTPSESTKGSYHLTKYINKNKYDYTEWDPSTFLFLVPLRG
jgi:hypothetical protein